MTVTFSPSPVAVGNVVAGQSGTATVTVTNTASTAESVALSGATFTMSPSPLPVGANSSATATITFLPTAVQSYSGTLTATPSNATCSVTGTGIEATQETLGSASGTRFHIDVPTATTSFVLGTGIDSSNATYNGFGLTTTGTGYLNAETAIGIYSKKSTYVAAGSGLFLGATIQNVSGIDGLSGVASRAGLGFGVLDTAIALASGVRGIVNTAIGWKGSSWVSSMFGIIGVLNAGAATGLGLASFAAGVDSNISLSTAGITVYGEAGILMGTPAYCSVYALAGLVLGSLYPLMCGMESEVYGLRTAALSGLTEATVQSLLKTTVQAAGMTGSGGEVEIKAGSKVTISAADAAKLTGDLEMEAGTSIAANAKGHGLKLSASGARLGVWAGDDTNKKDLVWVDGKSTRVQHSKAIEVYSDAKIQIWPAGKKTEMLGDATGWKINGKKIKLG